MEIARQPVCLLLLVAAVLLMALASVQVYGFGEDGKFARDSALAIHAVFGLLLGGYAACTTLSREMDSGTALSVLSKPVSRDLFFLAKFAGLSLLVALFSAGAVCACLLAENASPKLYVPEPFPLAILLGVPVAALTLAGAANYRWRWPFAATASGLILLGLAGGVAAVVLRQDAAANYRMADGVLFSVAGTIQWRLVPAGLLVMLALWLLAGLALALATRFRTPTVIVLCAAALFLGLLAPAGLPATQGWRSFVPQLRYFWMADALTAGGRIPWSHVGWAAAYAAAFLLVIVPAGLILFRHRDVR